MPIRPENMARYPGGSTSSKEWAAIKAFIRARAGDRCEQCGVHNHHYGVRVNGEFMDLGDNEAMGLLNRQVAVLEIGELADLLPPLIRIVCTVAHLDHGLTDHSPANLRFWCQQCHNRHDAKDRAAGIKARRMASQGSLL